MHVCDGWLVQVNTTSWSFPYYPHSSCMYAWQTRVTDAVTQHLASGGSDEANAAVVDRLIACVDLGLFVCTRHE